jgi:hypothetical protein
MIEPPIVPVHQHGACIPISRNKRQSLGQSQCGQTNKAGAVLDSDSMPIFALTAGRELLSRRKAMSLADRGVTA